MTKKEQAFYDRMLLLGRKIWINVSEAAVTKAPLNDFAIFSEIVFSTPDGRKMTYNTLYSFPEVNLRNSHYQKDVDKFVGDKIQICFSYRQRFDITLELYSDTSWDDDLHFITTQIPGRNRCNQELDKETMTRIEDYFKSLVKLTKDLKYEPEQTHTIENINDNARKLRNIAIYNEEVSKLPEGEIAIPSVKAAVDWWVQQMTAKKVNVNLNPDSEALEEYEAHIQEMQDILPPLDFHVEKFREILSKKIMEALSTGCEDTAYRYFELETDYSPYGALRDAINESGITPFGVPCKTSMYITPEKVYIRAAYASDDVIVYDEPHEIFKYFDNEQQPSETEPQL